MKPVCLSKCPSKVSSSKSLHKINLTTFSIKMDEVLRMLAVNEFPTTKSGQLAHKVFLGKRFKGFSTNF